MFATLFVLLYVAHLLADYPGQSDHQAGFKDKPGWQGWQANLTHAATHVAITALVLGVGTLLLDEVALGVWPTLLTLLWIGGTHGFIDRRWPVLWWMRHTGSTDWIERGGAAHVDQTAHITALAIAALALAA